MPNHASNRQPADSDHTADSQQPSAVVPTMIREDISADVVHIEQGGAVAVQANIITVNQGGIQNAKAEKIEVEQGGIAQAQADMITISLGGVGIAQAKHLEITEGSVGVMTAEIVDASNVKAGFLFAHKVNGDIQTIITQKTAAIFGLATGFALGVLLLLFRPRK